MTSTLPISTSPHSATLARLVEQVRAVVQNETDQERVGLAVAKLLKPCLEREDFLTPEQMEPDPNGYRQHILHVEPDGSFSIVSLVWLPGQSTCIHDHVSWCVVGVYRGQEDETQYAKTDGVEPHLMLTGNSVNPSGTVAALIPPGDIHRVGNGCDGLAVSLHIYGADIAKLGCSIRRRYNFDVQEPAEASAAR